VQQSPRLHGHRLSIIRQIAEGLGYVHRKGIVHRDICPKNVMVMPNNVAKLIDFGVAIACGDRVSDTGRRTGRPSYMAPELIRSNVFDERTDIYALGVTMYEVVTGVRPFIGRNRYEKMQMHLQVEAMPPGEIAADVSQRLSSIIIKALAKDPDKRYQDMGSLLDDLSLVM
jgi:serine/threonine protein kinase